MKKLYQDPKMDIEVIAVEDVITTSNGCVGYTAGENQTPGI